MTKEQVFVVDRAAFFDGDWPNGFLKIDDPEAFLERAWNLGRFVDRDRAEEEPAWKQWIPYCMLRCGDWSPSGDPAERGILAVQRTKKGSEARLHQSWSVGLGGHIEPVDAVENAGKSDAKAFFDTALRRELSEELDFPEGALPTARLLGMINDDTTNVGQVHAGLAYSVDLELPICAAKELVGIQEVSKLQGGFTHLVEFAKLWQTGAQFETWSQLLIEAEIVGAMGGRSWNGAASAEEGGEAES